MSIYKKTKGVLVVAVLYSESTEGDDTDPVAFVGIPTKTFYDHNDRGIDLYTSGMMHQAIRYNPVVNRFHSWDHYHIEDNGKLDLPIILL